MSKDLFGLTTVAVFDDVLVASTGLLLPGDGHDIRVSGDRLEVAQVLVSAAAFGSGVNRNLFMLANAISSFSSRSLSDFINLKRLRRRNNDPFSNMSSAAGCKAQYAPLPGLSGRRGIFTKQSLKDKLCLSEFCHLCVFLR